MSNSDKIPNNNPVNINNINLLIDPYNTWNP